MKNLFRKNEPIFIISSGSITKDSSIEEVISRIKRCLEIYTRAVTIFLKVGLPKENASRYIRMMLRCPCSSEDLRNYVKFFELKIKGDSSINLQELNSIRESMSELKKIIINENFISGELNIAEVEEFRSLAIEFFEFLDDVCERKQAKSLVLVSRNFIVPHAVTKFAFAGNKAFTFVPMDSFLNILGLKQEAVFSVFNRLLPRIKQPSPDSQENEITKPDNTPREESANIERS